MTKDKAVKALKTISVFTLTVLALIYSEETADSVVNSINVCLGTIIPSMFIFMVLTTYIQSSGLYRYIFRPVMWLMRKMIKADDSVISVFLLSLFGGYPIGLKLLKEMIAQNKSYHEIERVCSVSATFCYCISPTFALIMIGNGVFGSTTAGMIIYVSDILSCLITAAVVSRVYRLKTDIPSVTDPSGGSITSAVNSASKALFVVCSVIIAFNTVLTISETVLHNLGSDVSPVLTGIFEISNLLKLQHPDASFIPLAAAIASMGGICVMMQCASIVNGAFSVKRFIIARIPCAILSAAISALLIKTVNVSVSVSTYSSAYNYEFSANKMIVLVLIAMCIIIFHRSDKILKKV